MTAPIEVSLFAALGDDTRWAVLQRIAQSPASASALADELPVSRQAIGKHLDVLAAVGLAEPSRVGREVQWTAIGSRLLAASRALETVARGWDRRLDRIRRAAASPDV